MSSNYQFGISDRIEETYLQESVLSSVLDLGFSAVFRQVRFKQALLGACKQDL